MSSLCSLLILFFSFFLLFSTVTAFDISKILGDDSDFSSFNAALAQTRLAADINNRQTITVLVVANSKLSALSGKSTEMMRKILSVHVILDYFDADRFKSLPNKTSTLTTLFQSSGLAKGQEGFVNVTEKDGKVLLGSAVKGSNIDITVVKSVFAQPFNISVLQISDAILPPISSSPSKAPAKAPSPSKSKAPASGPAPASAESPEAADTPAGSPPAPAMAPGSLDSPIASPPGPLADGPAADSPSAKSWAIVGKDTSLTMLLVAISSAWVVAKTI
ncbi:fasciclin-like arabinogalactan protein 14 [Euphorbia lathyris]|uniref:fasciclin-like arabinogalactan protein 14 n=1 Tax=Euphorbia lathyris TaxID=212925 RepID=UPI003313EE80